MSARDLRARSPSGPAGVSKVQTRTGWRTSAPKSLLAGGVSFLGDALRA